MLLKRNPNPEETDPQIPAALPRYTFSLRGTAKKMYILIHNGEREKVYPVNYLIEIYKSEVFQYPEPVRDMARQALETYKLLPDLEKEIELSSDTITTIEGVKVYQELTRGQRFFAKVSGRVVRSKSIGEIEKAITGE
jgi:hypothetical protein